METWYGEIKQMKDVKVWYWLGEPNFGDMLNANICKDLFNINAIPVAPKECQASFIGSVLDDFLYPHVLKNAEYKKLYAQQPVNIWGSGFICDKNHFIKRPFGLPECFYRRINVHAVRGKFSRDRLEQITKTDLSGVVLGDPGLLAGMLLKHMPRKKYKIGIIPHHIELQDDLWERFKDIPGVTFINVSDSVENTLYKIAECETIASSAMHGLIAADSMYIPNIRLVASNKLIGGDYKFNDYYSAYGLDKHKKINVIDNDIPHDLYKYIKEHYVINPENIKQIQKNLYKSFPYKKD